VELWSAVEPHHREYHDDVDDHVLEEAQSRVDADVDAIRELYCDVKPACFPSPRPRPILPRRDLRRAPW
jgi:hypothetical protein